MKPQPLPPLSEKQIRAFWSYVDKRGPDDCWLWTGGTTSRKYSCLRYGAFNYRANGVHKILRPHRIAWTLQVGPIPDDMTIDHVAGRCTSTLCMNARHMETVTHEENVRRRVGDTTPHKYRKPSGESVATTPQEEVLPLWQEIEDLIAEPETDKAAAPTTGGPQ